MKAIRVNELGDPQVMQLEEMSDLQPGAGQVLVAVRAAGVNPVDTYIRGGIQGYSANCPYTPGLDAAGVVEAVGEGVTKFAPGDRVYCAGTVSGAYAEKCVCNEAQLHPLPEKVSFSQGAAIGVPYATACRALFYRAKARSLETVLIHGATGGVGVAALQMALAAGMTVIASGGTGATRKQLLELGAHYTADHTDSAHIEQVLELTNGQGVDVILEMLANVNLGDDLPALAKGGRVVVIGSRGKVKINPRDLMTRDAQVMGMAVMNATPDEIARIHAYIVAGLENGALKPVVAEELPLAEAPLAHERVMGNRDKIGKIVLITQR